MAEERTFFFTDNDSGEEFFVMAYTLSEARKKARALFVKPRYIEEVTFEEAEMMGLDTY